MQQASVNPWKPDAAFTIGRIILNLSQMTDDTKAEICKDTFVICEVSFYSGVSHDGYAPKINHPICYTDNRTGRQSGVK